MPRHFSPASSTDVTRPALTVPPPARRLGQGSWLLASALQRMAAAVAVSAALWVLTAWAMGWL